MKVKVIVTFNDKQNGYINRPVNEVFECSKARGEELIELGYVEEVVEDEPEQAEPTDEQTEQAEPDEENQREKQKHQKQLKCTCVVTAQVLLLCPKAINYGRHRAKLIQRDTL